MRLDPQIIAQQISQLFLQYPQLAEDEILRSDTIEGETDAFEFLASIICMIEDAKALADGTGNRIDDLQARKGRFEHRIEALRSLAFKIMQAAELKKAELPCATLSVRAGTPKVIITEEGHLPESCVKVTVTRVPDKTAIKDALLQGENVPGACLSNAEPSLTIRVK